ncbi:HAD family hydrolase [Humibacter sp.]|uniref:HAD family hydrolase n=1 Tax=Humibacter sp. TaxID=1940291 RepID=UPI003F7EB2AE
MTSAAPAAVLFDMDGTLVDTEPYWMQAETELVTEHGGTWTHDDALVLVGSGLWESAKVFQQHGVDLDADTIVAALTRRVQEQLESQGVPWRPGAKELLLDIRERGVKTALVTMSIRDMAEQIVAQIPFPAFDVLVTGDEVARPKPYADPYLDAARELGVLPQDCVAIEDSMNGLASAVAAGTIAIGVPHMIPLPASDEHTLWPTLEGVSFADLAELFEERAA